jgi:putative nucleotidyltransferase with HDIG domain
MKVESTELLRKRLQGIDKIPSLPVVIGPLIRYLEQPLDQLDIQHVVDLISQDKSLTAQCLHLANSPLFGRWQAVDSIRGAVMALGMQRMRDIAFSCAVLKISPRDQSCVPPSTFWEHSLACALVSRRFASRIGFADPGKAYLAALLHDIGIIVNLWLMPREFGEAVQLARARCIPLHEAELETMGLTHCDSGTILAEKWELPQESRDVIAFHHDVTAANSASSLLSLVSLSDLLCRMSGIGHGMVEERQVDFLDQPGFAILLRECPSLNDFDWARLTFELEGYLDEVRRLVALLYRRDE